MVTSLTATTNPTSGTNTPTVMTFGAGYNADGTLTTENYPNGMTATTTLDNDGDPTKLTYAKGSTQWVAFAATRGADSRIVAMTNTRAGAQQSRQDYTYDGAGRLTQVKDNVAATGICSTRQYWFAGTTGLNSNRSSLTTADSAAGGTCPTSATAPATAQNVYDTADHLTNAGYVYDSLGRTTSMPAVDTAGVGGFAGTTGDLTVGYWGNDLVHTESQPAGPGGVARVLTYDLDPNSSRIRRITDTASGGAVTTNHYDGDNDSPDWTSTSTTAAPDVDTGWSRLIEGPDGDLAATVDQTGAVTLKLANLHGDIAATAANDVTATAVATYSESTEFGAPRTPATAPSPYGWTGEKRRSNQDLAGLITMGVRLYNPATGRFLQVDPVEGGSANDYVYPTDPINMFDLNGQSWRKKWFKRFAKVAGAASSVFGSIPFCAACQSISLGAGLLSAGFSAGAGDWKQAGKTLALTALSAATLGTGRVWRAASGARGAVGRGITGAMNASKYTRRGEERFRRAGTAYLNGSMMGISGFGVYKASQRKTWRD